MRKRIFGASRLFKHGILRVLYCAAANQSTSACFQCFRFLLNVYLKEKTISLNMFTLNVFSITYENRD